jgi:hypothetical protein
MSSWINLTANVISKKTTMNTKKDNAAILIEVAKATTKNHMINIAAKIEYPKIFFILILFR